MEHVHITDWRIDINTKTAHVVLIHNRIVNIFECSYDATYFEYLWETHSDYEATKMFEEYLLDQIILAIEVWWNEKHRTF